MKKLNLGIVGLGAIGRIDAFHQKILGNPAKVIDFSSGHKTTEVIESLLNN